MESSKLLKIPKWLIDIEPPKKFDNDSAMMDFAIFLAMKNVQLGTGGPFSAFIFSRKCKLVISMGVNTVVPLQCSIAHAEIMAIVLGQKREQKYDLKDLDCELVTSCEPCGMCLGAILWSGISRIIFGATSKDAESIGFDEGIKPDNWQNSCFQRGINVVGPINQESAANVLIEYHTQKKEIYNSGFALNQVSHENQK